MQLDDAVDKFLLSIMAGGKSERTADAYRWSLSKFVRMDGGRHVETLKPDRLVEWMAGLREQRTPRGDPLSAASLRNAYTALKAFCRWLEREKKTRLKLDEKLVRPREPDPDIDPFSREDVAKLLYAAQWQKMTEPCNRRAFRTKRVTASRDHLLMLFLLDTGARIGEVTRADVAEYEPGLQRVWLRPHGSGRKTAGRFVYLSDGVVRLLDAYIARRKADGRDPLFIGRDGARLDRFAVKNMMRRLSERSGVRDVHPHRFRHTMAIEYLRNGGDIFTLQRLLGHKDLGTARRYLKFVQTDLSSTHRRASPVASWGL